MKGSAWDNHWELRLPQAANQFDFTTIADVLITIDYTALHDADYQARVLGALRPTVSLSRAFGFRNQLADAWYDLNNPDQSATPMTVKFTTARDDFPPGITNLALEQVALYFARSAGSSFEIDGVRLSFTPAGGGTAMGRNRQHGRWHDQHAQRKRRPVAVD